MAKAWRKSLYPMSPKTWNSFMQLIKPVIDAQNGRITVDEIVRDLATGKCDVWIREFDGEVRSLVIARVRQYESGLRVMHIQFGAGLMEDFFDYIDEAAEVARINRCHRLQVSGRSGWKRALEQHGHHDWSEISRTIEREV